MTLSELARVIDPNAMAVAVFVNGGYEEEELGDDEDIFDVARRYGDLEVEDVYASGDVITITVEAPDGRS